MNRKLLAVLCLTGLLLSLAACGGKAAEGPDANIPENTVEKTGLSGTENSAETALALARAVVESQPNASDYINQASMEDPEALDAYLELYGLDLEELSEAAVLYAGGVTAYEVAVLRLKKDGITAEDAALKLQDYILSRTASFTGYAPEQAAVLEGAILAIPSEKDMVAILICEDGEAASEVCNGFFQGEAVPPGGGEDSQSAGETSQPVAELSAGESRAAAAVLAAASEQPNAGDYDHLLVYGTEEFAEWVERLEVDADALRDGAVCYAGDGKTDLFAMFCLKEDAAGAEDLFYDTVAAFGEQGVDLYSSIFREDAMGFYVCQDTDIAQDGFPAYFEVALGAEEELFGPSALEVAQAAVDTQEDAADYTASLLYGQEAFDTRVKEYGINSFILTDGAVLCTEDGGHEVAILRLSSRWFGNSNDLTSSMHRYIQDKGGQGTIKSCGLYIFGNRDSAYLLTLFLCEDVDAAWNGFQSTKNNFNAGGGSTTTFVPTVEPEAERDEQGRIVFKSPGVYDMTPYDTAAILTAWESGDSAALSDKDRAILEAAREAIAQTVQEGMSDYEKELALHDWLIAHTEYDTSSMGGDTESKSCMDPYGALVEGKAICLGYATTFKLLMDMAGVECQVVVGASFNSMEDHAWNLVRLDGEWYGVDPTWNDPILPAGLPEDYPQREGWDHKYFNVDDAKLLESDHQWAYDDFPQATGTKYAWTASKP